MVKYFYVPETTQKKVTSVKKSFVFVFYRWTCCKNELVDCEWDFLSLKMLRIIRRIRSIGISENCSREFFSKVFIWSSALIESLIEFWMNNWRKRKFCECNGKTLVAAFVLLSNFLNVAENRFLSYFSSNLDRSIRLVQHWTKTTANLNHWFDEVTVNVLVSSSKS